MLSLLKLQKTKIASFVLSLYCFPLFFTRAPDDNIDGSWIRALNINIKNGLVFGKDFIYTYGPLGFLSTRNSRFIDAYIILAGDIFLFIGFFYFINKYISVKKGWFLITLASMILLRDAHYSQTLFLIFIAFTTLTILNDFNNYFELTFICVAGMLLFFIKINYGLIALIILTVIAFILIFKNINKFIVFTSILLLTFCIIYLNVHIDIINYIKNSLMLYRHYDEAVYYNLPVWNPVLLSAIFLTILLFELIIRHCIICLKQKMLTLGKIAMITILIMASFLFFRNGFTRADGIHYAEFFAISPFLIIAILFITASDNNKQSKIIAIVAIVISSYNLILPQVVKQSINLRLLTPVAYFTDVFQEQRLYKSNMLLNENENKLLGNSTIDILPDRIALLDNSNLNYAPRPVPQSYTVYTKDLDSINATYFYKQLRPEYVLIKAGHFDNRYDFWNESLTKASLHLNYTCKDNQMQDYLLLSSKNNSTYPQFEVQNTRVINLTDTVYINNPDSIVCYMTAKINYTFWGEVYRMLYSAPKLNIIFFLEDGTSQEYQVVCPMLNIPSLISKSITTNNDMKNFFSGCVKKCKNIKAFTLHPRSAGFAIKYTLTFLKFSNY